MRHSKTTKAIALILSLVMITSVFVGNTLSRYVTSVSSTDSARVAIWGINGAESTMNLFDTQYIVDDKTIAAANNNGDGTFDKIMAPGTKGEAAFNIINFEQNVAPEVAYEVKISLDDSEIHEKIKNNPSVQWKLDNGAYGTWDQLKISILSLAGNETGKHTYGPGEFATAFQGTQTHKIAWQWVMDNSNNVMDTEMGNLTLTNDLNAVIKVSITAQQVDDLLTNNYILDGANQIVNLNDVKPITIRSFADFSTFESVEVNDVPLTRDVDYTAESGSTVITLTEEYLSKLAVGTYTINIISTDITASTKFNVVKDLNEFIPDIPENQGVANVLLNFEQLKNISYIPKATIPNQSYDFKPGIKYKGMPYSSSRIEEGFAPNFVSFETFMTALQNPKSYMYTVDLGELGNINGDTYYGIVCSSAVGYALNIEPNYTTHQWKDIPGMEPLEEQSISALKLGDTISNKESGHVVMVTGITRNGLGEIGSITISQAGNPRVSSNTYTPDEIANKYPTSGGNNYYVYYRYNKISEVQYTPSKYVAVGDEIQEDVYYNTNIIPRKGDKANWLKGQPIEIDLFNSLKFTDVEVYKNDSLFDTISIIKEELPTNRNIIETSWELGGLQSADGNTNILTTRSRTNFISSIDLKVTTSNDVKISLFFYDSDMTYISSSGFITDTNVISIKDKAPDNATFVRILVAYNNNDEITDINAITSNVEIKISDDSSIMPINKLTKEKILTESGETINSTIRLTTDFIQLQNYEVSVNNNNLEYYLHYYDIDKNYISNSGKWISDKTELFKVAPNNTEYIRIVIRKKDDSHFNSITYLKFAALIRLNVISGKVKVDDMITLTDLEYGSYKARLTNGTTHSDWCYWIVVDPIVTAIPTSNDKEVSVTFSANNAEPLFVKWSASSDKGTKHINVLTDEQKNDGTVVCQYKSGKYHIRVAFKTEYGIIHSELGPVININ